MCCRRLSQHLRIIPTRVGTRFGTLRLWRILRDHPHACGDKQKISRLSGLVVGSSPRVWGQVKSAIGIFDTYRIIPTRVGTRINPFFFSSPTRDHPHACGDKFFPAHDNLGQTGSSPRVWGQAIILRCADTLSRIIPTRMGTSCKSTRTEQKARDHPHAYGDKAV